MAKDLVSVGQRYEWVTLAYLVGFAIPLPFWLINRYRPHIFWRYINLSIICWYMGYLFWYLRKHYPVFFVKYNYIVSAALDGGTQVMVFILTFAVFGGSGKAYAFPTRASNPDTSIHNLDYCMKDMADYA